VNTPSTVDVVIVSAACGPASILNASFGIPK
jgi:hypothetical protein